MEHRCSVRKQLGFQLLLYKHGVPIQGGTCRNLGLGGLYIETAGRDWHKNEYVEVEIYDGRRHAAMRLPAVVVHFDAAGAGLMFDVVSGAQRRRLRDWLIDAPVAESRRAARRAVA